MNKKLIAFFSILSLFLSTPLIPVNAAAKAGAKCTKAGITEVVKGKSYTCVKSGKKLVWDKGNTKPSMLLALQQSKLWKKHFLLNSQSFQK
jgi:hypothetical protein